MVYYEEFEVAKPITRREIEVLRLVARGMQNKEIARELSIAESTVQNHLIHIYRKTGLSNRTEATRWAFDNDMFD